MSQPEVIENGLRTACRNARLGLPTTRSGRQTQVIAREGLESGWEAGIRNRMNRFLQLADGAHVVVTTRSAIVASGQRSLLASPRALPRIILVRGDIVETRNAPTRPPKAPAGAQADNPVLARLKALASLAPASRGCGLDTVSAQASWLWSRPPRDSRPAAFHRSLVGRRIRA
jgi:hypothetical protein